MNVEIPKLFRPPHNGDGSPIGAALREAVNDRFDRMPDQLRSLLDRLERRGRAA